MTNVELIKDIINRHIKREGLSVKKIILFGSRAKGNWKEDSDWDLLILVDKEISFQKMKKISGDIQVSLAREKIPNDIIIRSDRDFAHSRKIISNISFYANKEGTEI